MAPKAAFVSPMLKKPTLTLAVCSPTEWISFETDTEEAVMGSFWSCGTSDLLAPVKVQVEATLVYHVLAGEEKMGSVVILLGQLTAFDRADPEIFGEWLSLSWVESASSSQAVL